MTIENIERVKTFQFKQPTPLPYSIYTLPSVQPQISHQEKMSIDIKRFLETLKIPQMKSLQAKKHFLKRSKEFYVKDQKLFKRNNANFPLW
jgi:hypothetical protein